MAAFCGLPLSSGPTAKALKPTQTQGLRACQALLEPLSRPLWVWKGSLPGHLLDHTRFWGPSDGRGNPQCPRWKATPAGHSLSLHASHHVLCQCLLAWLGPFKAACSWSVGGLLAQYPIFSWVEQGGTEVVGISGCRCTDQSHAEQKGWPEAGLRVDLGAA